MLVLWNLWVSADCHHIGVQTIDPRQLQINLTGFLEKNTTLFCKVRMQLHVAIVVARVLCRGPADMHSVTQQHSAMEHMCL